MSDVLTGAVATGVVRQSGAPLAEMIPVNGAGEIAGQLAIPVEFPAPVGAAALNGGAVKRPHVAARIASRGDAHAAQVSTFVSELGNMTAEVLPERVVTAGTFIGRAIRRSPAFMLGLTVGTVITAAKVVWHAPSVLSATVRSVPDAFNLALGPVDVLSARIGGANADYWTTNSIANTAHQSRLHSQRSAAAAQLGSGPLRATVNALTRRADGKTVSNRELYLHRADNSAEWANSADGARRDMKTRRARIADRFRQAVS